MAYVEGCFQSQRRRIFLNLRACNQSVLFQKPSSPGHRRIEQPYSCASARKQRSQRILMSVKFFITKTVPVGAPLREPNKPLRCLCRLVLYVVGENVEIVDELAVGGQLREEKSGSSSLVIPGEHISKTGCVKLICLCKVRLVSRCAVEPGSTPCEFIDVSAPAIVKVASFLSCF